MATLPSDLIRDQIIVSLAAELCRAATLLQRDSGTAAKLVRGIGELIDDVHSDSIGLAGSPAAAIKAGLDPSVAVLLNRMLAAVTEEEAESDRRLGIKPVTIHDLRGAAERLLSDLGNVDPDLADAAIIAREQDAQVRRTTHSTMERLKPQAPLGGEVGL